MSIQVIAGLGNPGSRYQTTRHNVGFWFINDLIRRFGGELSADRRFNAETGRTVIAGTEVRLITPLAFMNCSGQVLGEFARYFKLDPRHILVVHDELDLAPGVARLKKGGGHGGHNGLRDIHAHLGTKDYCRLRLGIGHPGNSKEVTNYVLGSPTAEEQKGIENAIDAGLDVLEILLRDGLEKAMHKLHSSC